MWMKEEEEKQQKARKWKEGIQECEEGRRGGRDDKRVTQVIKTGKKLKENG